MGACEDIVHLLAGQKRLEDDYKDPDMLPKVNTADMAGTMEAIKKYLRSHYGVIRVPVAYVIRKSIIVQTYGDYPTYATPNDKMIVMILHLPPDKNRLHNEQSALSIKKHTAEHEIDKRSFYDILYQICKDINLYPCVNVRKYSAYLVLCLCVRHKSVLT